MDNQLDRTMKTFFYDPAGWSTHEIYQEYLNICKEDKVEPRLKSTVIREICKEFDCNLKEVRTKYFIRD